MERFSKKVYFEIVPRRTQQILMKIIEDKVEPESVIISDSWRAYLGMLSNHYANILVSFNYILRY